MFLIVVRMGCARVWDELFCHRRYVLVIIQKSIKPKLIIHPPTVSEYKFLVSVCQGPRKRGATGAAPPCRNGPCMQLVASQAVEFYIQ